MIASHVWAEGQLPDDWFTAGALADFVNPGVGIVVTLNNRDSSPHTCDLYYQHAGATTVRRLCRVVLDADGGSATYELRAAEAGDLLFGQADVADWVDFVIGGGEVQP